MPDLDSYLVRHALTVAREHGYAEVEVALDGSSFTASLEAKKATPRSTKEATVSTEPEFKFIKSTLVGYLQELSLNVGDEVKTGQIVAEVTALGIANEIESPIAGFVSEILVEQGAAVEYGQPLAKVMPE